MPASRPRFQLAELDLPPLRAAPELLRLLALMGPGDMSDNAPFDFVVDGSDIALDLLYLQPGLALPAVLPEHDLAIVAIGQSEANAALLDWAEACIADWPRPVLNRPAGIRRCARDRVWQLLRGVPGLCVPATRRLRPAELADGRLPLTLRPLDTHGGKGLVRVETPAERAAWIAAQPLGDDGPEWYAADYIDYRSADGQFRKYRIALIDGRPFLCHLAIDGHWIVHYQSAGMGLDAAKQAEEAAAMAGFETGFALRHRAALAAIAEAIALEYLVIDCSELADGRLLLFEVDGGAWIHAADVALLPYKAPHMARTFAAFRALLLDRSTARAAR